MVHDSLIGFLYDGDLHGITLTRYLFSIADLELLAAEKEKTVATNNG
ncbi:hypothetical protein [Sporomusa acidovorans]|uniref:Uncharacterized protein n=1 Tax=Sporomusa acidovorans (strain ATCC 49682 / DSM 3132 / Mol) TaxID=1123286 RepID=A0ABZ3J6G0_SPOA4|nr:hypothetical protein [Sporomusa acidovorans]OZC24189.1 hypothetical protein SPACI_01640 [Sporomusa acidovorans DSM 3132]SDF77657.1 hypothetical protein SAMN04488499_10819 [Sporomusa acidovorans]